MNQFTLGRGKFVLDLHLSQGQTDDEATKKLLKCLELTIPALEEHFSSDPDCLIIGPKMQRVECCLNICGEAKIRSLNSEYRGKEQSTDVLAFPIHDDLRTKPQRKGDNWPLLNLGDIYICHQVAKAQAKRLDISYEDEVIHLMVHGLLHLVGYDHEISRQEEELMTNKESQLIDQIVKYSRKH